MAGSHRAPAPERRSRTPAIVLLAVLLVAAATGGVYALNRNKDDGAGPTAPPTPATTAPSTTTPTTPAVSPTPTSTPRPTAKPLPRVKPSAPRRLVAQGLFDVGFDSTVTPRNGVFTAGSTAEVARWGGRGVPGNPSHDTVYLIGKVSADGAFERLARLHRGGRLSLRTQTGLLTYTVHTTVARPAAGLTHTTVFTHHVPGRLVLVGIRYDSHGDRTGTIVVVTAQLTGARSTG